MKNKTHSVSECLILMFKMFQHSLHTHKTRSFILNYCKQVGGVEKEALSRSAPSDT